MKRLKMRRPEDNSKLSSSQQGFSLLEILVSLAVLSAVATLVTVSSVSMVQSMRERTELRQLTNQVEMFRYVALTKDQQITLHSDPARNSLEQNIPNGWQMRATPSIVFSRHGTCTTGSLVLTSPRGRVYNYFLVPQSCRLQVRDR